MKNLVVNLNKIESLRWGGKKNDDVCLIFNVLPSENNIIINIIDNK